MNKAVESLRVKLIKIAAKEQIAYQNIQTLFLLERMVARLTQNPILFNKLIFKGGYVGVRIFDSPRYTIDLDALIKNADVEEISNMAIIAVSSNSEEGIWFQYEKQAKLLTLGEYGGLRLYFRGGIGAIPTELKKAQSIHLDLGIGDAVIPAPVKSKIPSLLGDDADSITWKVYTVESATAEKLHTLIVRGRDNSRSKDVFDLYYFLPQCKKEILIEAIAGTFKARGDELPSKISHAVSRVDRDLLKRGWKNATAALKEEIDFDEAFSLIVAFCEEL